jgi:hypothetical protein
MSDLFKLLEGVGVSVFCLEGVGVSVFGFSVFCFFVQLSNA